MYVGGVITGQASENGAEFGKNVQRDVQHTDRSGRSSMSRINMNAAGIQEKILGQSDDILKVVNFEGSQIHRNKEA